MGIAAPADKHFRRAHVKPVRKRERRSRTRSLVRRALLTAAAGFALYRALVSLDGAAVLQVKRVTVRGNARLSTGAVMALLEGIEGRNILATNLSTWRLRLLESPWIEDAAVRRTLPSSVDVAITERRPIGICRIGGSLYLVDAHGAVIDEYGPEYADIDLPIIQGLEHGSRGPAGPVAGASSFGVDVERADLAARALAALGRRDIAERISEVDVTDPYNVAVILEGDTAVIRLGREAFLERLLAYLDLAAALRERIPAIDYVDLRFDRRAYVRPVAVTNGGRPGESGAGAVR